MASEINQILPIALGTLAHGSPAAQALLKSNSVAGTRDTQINPQALAALQKISKVASDPKEQQVQVPKRSEPNFSTDDEKEHQDPQYLGKPKGKAKDGSINIVA